jgi:ABC-type nitrate/sulfonate/bicarbonate transport system substrate-binding protein
VTLSRRVFNKLAALGCAAITTVSLLATSTAAAQSSPRELSVIVFPGGFNWPIWVAQEKGIFARHGVKVNTVDTPNSRFQLTGMIEGKFDIAMTAIDNLIAYREGQGGIDADANELIAVMGADNGFLRLTSVPEIRSLAELKGKQLSVDALTTGYAFVLLEILARNGLMLDRDYTTVAAGGVLQRYQSLLKKDHAATMLISPFEVMAKTQGFNVLADADTALGDYQGLVAGVRKTWAKQNARDLVGFIRGYREALNWLYDPANKQPAIDLFVGKVKGATPQSAATSYDVLLNPKTGFTRDAKISEAGTRTVIELREKFGKPAKKMQGLSAYYDPTWYNESSR